MVNEQGYDEMPITPDQIAEAYRLAKDLRELEVEAEKKEAELKEVKERVLQLATKALPECMAKMRLRELTLPGGNILIVEDKIQAHISKERADEAHKWLDEHQHGGMVKRVVSVAFTREEEEKAKALVKLLKETTQYSVKVEQWVEPQTLKAFAKERLLVGDEEFPKQLFGVHRYDQAEIKEPKKKSKKGAVKDSVFGE